MLETVHLSAFADRLPAQLSGGQQQRVALARALAPEPKALLLDEPLSALDLKLRQAMRVELKQLQEQTGITFVFVTHDQEEALTMSDRIAVMSAGRVQQIGTAREIYEAPPQPLRRRLHRRDEPVAGDGGERHRRLGDGGPPGRQPSRLPGAPTAPAPARTTSRSGPSACRWRRTEPCPQWSSGWSTSAPTCR